MVPHLGVVFLLFPLQVCASLPPGKKRAVETPPSPPPFYTQFNTSSSFFWTPGGAHFFPASLSICLLVATLGFFPFPGRNVTYVGIVCFFRHVVDPFAARILQTSSFPPLPLCRGRHLTRAPPHGRRQIPFPFPSAVPVDCVCARCRARPLFFFLHLSFNLLFYSALCFFFPPPPKNKNSFSFCSPLEWGFFPLSSEIALLSILPQPAIGRWWAPRSGSFPPACLFCLGLIFLFTCYHGGRGHSRGELGISVELLLRCCFFFFPFSFA